MFIGTSIIYSPMSPFPLPSKRPEKASTQNLKATKTVYPLHLIVKRQFFVVILFGFDYYKIIHASNRKIITLDCSNSLLGRDTLGVIFYLSL